MAKASGSGTGPARLSLLSTKCKYFVAIPGDPELRLSHGRWVSAGPGKLRVRTVNSDTPSRTTASSPAQGSARTEARCEAPTKAAHIKVADHLSGDRWPGPPSSTNTRGPACHPSNGRIPL